RPRLRQPLHQRSCPAHVRGSLPADGGCRQAARRSGSAGRLTCCHSLAALLVFAPGGLGQFAARLLCAAQHAGEAFAATTAALTLADALDDLAGSAHAALVASAISRRNA